MKKRIAGFMMPKTKKYVFFVSCICVLAAGLLLTNFRTETTSQQHNPEDIRVPVLMYHSVLDNPKRVGKYVILPEELEKDLIYIRDHGYTTITSKDLIAYRANKGDLPEKPIMLTFDDGYYNNYTYLFPLLKKYNMKAVLSVVGTYADAYSVPSEILNNNYSHATWEQLKEMQQSGLVEIGNHSYNMHDFATRHGVLRNKGEDLAYYQNILQDDLHKMQECLLQKAGVEATVFAYPFGSVNKESRAVVESIGFPVTLGCEEGMNFIHKKSSLKDLKRYNRAGNADRNEFFARIEAEK